MTEEQGKALADELGIKFMETSAKVNEGVEEAFFLLARYIYAPSVLPTFATSADIKTTPYLPAETSRPA